MEITTGRLLLREAMEEDYSFFNRMETDEACIKFESDTIPDEGWIRNKLNETLKDKEAEPRNRYRMIVVNQETNESVGRVVLWKIDDCINEWEMGWDVLPEQWSNGYASEAAAALLRYAFHVLKVHRVQALCNDQNASSERVMIKIGMIKEGTLRGVRRLNDCWFGSHVYSLLDSEYEGYL